MFEGFAMFLVKHLSDKTVEKFYVRAGMAIAMRLDYFPNNKNDEVYEDFVRMTNLWEWWEREYSLRGFETIPLDGFLRCGRDERAIAMLGTKREKDEVPLIHAELFRKMLECVGMKRPKNLTASDLMQLRHPEVTEWR